MTKKSRRHSPLRAAAAGLMLLALAGCSDVAPEPPQEAPQPPVAVTVVTESTSAPSVAPETSTTLSGWSTYYADPRKSGLYAAAGPVLRRALGPDWRGQTVTVHAGAKSVTVVAGDFCACGSRAGEPTLIDLSPTAFARLAPLSAGVVRVTISIPPAPQVTQPPTDMEGP